MKHKYILKPPPDFFMACEVATSGFNASYSEKSLLWTIIKLIYEQNYPKKKSKNPVPKILHFIWLGGEIPEHYITNINDWSKKNPNFEIRTWTDEDAENFDMKNRKLFDEAENFGMKSDILRYEILYKYGGVYLDTDFFCLQPLDDLNEMFEFYSCVSLEREPIIGNGMIASAPNHEVIRYCIEEMTLNSDERIEEFSEDEKIMFLTGPMYFSSKIMKYVGDVAVLKEDIVLLPSKFFYPLPMNVSENIESYLEDYSKAIHLWHSSWQTGE